MFEKMDIFFEKRLAGYDEHMLAAIEGAEEFYKFTASLLPVDTESRILDLGCGTGLEPEEYFRLNPNAHITGKEKYNATVSVESLHHFTAEQKLSLYKRLWQALNPSGYFILTDYSAIGINDDWEETDDAFYGFSPLYAIICRNMWKATKTPCLNNESNYYHLFTTGCCLNVY